MNAMKKILMVAVALVISSGVFAQGGGQRMQMTPEQQKEMIKQRIDAMDKVVKLTDAEKVKVDSLFTDANKKMQALYTPDGDREQMRANMTKIREEQNTKLKAILGDERYKKYTESVPQGFGGGRPQQ